MILNTINASCICKFPKILSSSISIPNNLLTRLPTHLLCTQHPLKQSSIFNVKKFCSYRLMDLSQVVAILEEKLPPQLAESWDNTGLLIEPVKKKLISTILFTNDLTETVLDEALSKNADLIFSYHPPIFVPIKSLRCMSWKDRIILQCIEHTVAVYSPHTACDAVKGGVNDWLIKCFDLSYSQPIKQSFESSPKYSHSIEFSVPLNVKISEALKSEPDIKFAITNSTESYQHFRALVNKTSLNKTLELLSSYEITSAITPVSLSNLPLLFTGMGRIGKLKESVALRDCITLMKKHVKLNYIRFSQGRSHTLDTPISTVAVCAGSGSSILKGVVADLYVTGEMSHHDLLDANHRNISVILCEHSNSERGYLLELMNDLSSKLQGINLIMSSSDKDPVSIL